jgi:hypothetical protein
MNPTPTKPGGRPRVQVKSEVAQLRMPGEVGAQSPTPSDRNRDRDGVAQRRGTCGLAAASNQGAAKAPAEFGSMCWSS